MGATLLSCNHSTEKTNKTESNNTLEATLKPIIDSMNYAWELIIKADDQKISDLKRLLLEISYTDKYDVMAHDSLLRLTELLPSKRYQLESMTSDQINYYDAETDKVINAVRELAGRTPGIENHDIVPKLLNDIISANGDILIQQRRKYDESATQYNNYLEQNKEAIQNAGTPYNSLKKKELFTIGF